MAELPYLRRQRTGPARKRDRGSSRLWDVSHAVEIVGIIVGFAGIGRIAVSGAALGSIGLALLLIGIAVRWTAIYTLAALFTGQVVIRDNHRLVRTGLYARLRHPAYTGSLLAHIGLGLAFMNWWSLACSSVPYIGAVLYRMSVEEAALAEAFGEEYVEYARRTKRLIPWFY